jgi:hypothetical protein
MSNACRESNRPDESPGSYGFVLTQALRTQSCDGYYVLPSGQFTMARFQPVSAAEAGYA